MELAPGALKLVVPYIKSFSFESFELPTARYSFG
jgi:hypothetical protein